MVAPHPSGRDVNAHATGRWTSPDGVGLAYRESGRRDGATLLFLHGLSGSSATYDEVRTSFDATHRVLSLDFRGHGGSDRLPGTYQLPNYGADVAAFIEWIGRPVSIAGHSLGGAVATYLAGARSELVAGALLEDPPLYHGDRAFFATTIFPKAFAATRDTMRRLHHEGAGRDEVRAALLAQPTPTGGDPTDEATPATIESRVDAFLACDPSVFDPAITGDAIGGWDPDTPIPESVPLTLLRADPALHPAFLPDDEARFLRTAPHTRIVEINGAPHGIHAFAAATGRYLNELRSLLARAVAP
jgi:pimeloyl-ACP methyl ester carboxylesterase